MRALELFACSGALAAGFRGAGVTFDLAFDVSPDACASYEANLGTRPVQIDVRDLLRMARAGWSPGHLDLLVADPPCAPWSRAGKRKGHEDERDMLRETVELVVLLRPRAYLIGNIPGLEDKPNLKVVQATIGSLAKVGYCVRDHAVLNAVNYGVPQFRARPYWYGHLAGPCIAWPPRTHGDPALDGPELAGIGGLRPWVTCRQALAHLSVEDLGRPVAVAPPTHRLVHEKRTVSGMKSRQRIPQSARLGDPDRPAAAMTAKLARASAGDSVVLAWPWDRPATTILTTGQLAGPGHGPIMSRTGGLVLSELAGSIIQGFPEGWHFCGKTKASRWAQIGQAVPVVVAEALGRSVAAAMETA